VNELNLENINWEPVAYEAGKTTLWNQSWKDVYDKFGDAIRARARREGLNEHSQDDVVQEVMSSLIQVQLGQQPGHDPGKVTFQRWFWGLIHNRIRSVRRKDRKLVLAQPAPANAERDQPKSPEIEVPPPDFAQMEEDEWRQALLAAAMRRVQKRVSVKNFDIFTRLITKTATPDQLAKEYCLPDCDAADQIKARNAVDQANDRCKRMVQEEARSLQQAWKDIR
jgi:DNA-directed RNA polymerase specialized sigma24 family protein